MKKLNGRTKMEKMVNNGEFEEFRKECIRYGKMISSNDWESEGGTKVFRECTFIMKNGIIASFLSENGEVREIGVRRS